MQSTHLPVLSSPRSTVLRRALEQDKSFRYNFDPRLLKGTSADPYQKREKSLRKLDSAISSVPDRYACVGGGNTHTRTSPRPLQARSHLSNKNMSSSRQSVPQVVQNDGTVLRPDQFRTDISWSLSAQQMKSMGLAVSWPGMNDALKDIAKKFGLEGRNIDVEASLGHIISSPCNTTLDGKGIAYSRQDATSKDPTTHDITLFALCGNAAAGTINMQREQTLTACFEKRGEQGQEHLWDATGPGSYVAWYTEEDVKITFPTAGALVTVYNLRLSSPKASSTCMAASQKSVSWCSQSSSYLLQLPREVGQAVKNFLDHRSLSRLHCSCRDLKPPRNHDAVLMSTIIRESMRDIEETCHDSDLFSVGMLLNHSSESTSGNALGELRGRDSILYDAMKLAYRKRNVDLHEGMIRVEEFLSDDGSANKRRIVVLQAEEPSTTKQNASNSVSSSLSSSPLKPSSFNRALHGLCRSESISSIHDAPLTTLTATSSNGNVSEHYDVSGKRFYPRRDTGFILSHERINNIIGLKEPLKTTTFTHREGDSRMVVSYYRCSYITADVDLDDSPNGVAEPEANLSASYRSMTSTLSLSLSLADRMIRSKTPPNICWVDRRRGSLLTEEMNKQGTSPIA